MSIKTVLAITSAAVLLTGCATPKYNYTASPPASFSNPPINSINTAFVGDPLLSQGITSKRDVLILNQAAAISAYTLTAGEYIKHGQDEKSGYFIPSGSFGMVSKSWYADPWKSIQAYKNEQKLCVITVMNVAVCETNTPYQLTEKTIISNDTLQQTLIYSGKIGNKVNIGYREFTSNLARASFNNEVEYDFSVSNIIGYKGARLEIIEATNEKITYKLLKNFN